jgi:hypothetical protein
MRMLAQRTCYCAVALGFGFVCIARAQAPADRQALAKLALQIADSASDSASADSFAPSDLAIAFNSALGETRHGLLLLHRSAQSTSRFDLDAAQAAFDEAIYRAPDDWPWPWYGLALTDLALDSAGYTVKPSMHQPAGMYYRDAAIRALGMALAADSGFAPAAQLLAERLTSTSDPAFNSDVVRAIRRSVSTGVMAGPQPWLVFARLQRSLEHPDSALAAFRTYLAAGGDSALGLIEVARSLYANGDTEAAAPVYLRGARRATTADGRAEYRRDLAWIASPRELTTFDSLPPDSVGGWIQSFWGKRGAEELRAPLERLMEHLRRWDYVHSTFVAPQLNTRVAKALRMPLAERGQLPTALALASPDNSSSTGASNASFSDDAAPADAGQLFQRTYLGVAGGESVFLDDRAFVYMRHGEPSEIVQSPGLPGGASPLSWKYDTPNGPLILHFKCTLYCLLWRFPISLDGLIALDPHYEILAGQYRDGHVTPGLLHRVLSGIDRDLRVGLTTDGFPPHFKHQLSPQAQFYAVGSPSRVLVVFALPGDRLQGQRLADGGTGYPVTLRLIATNAQGQIARSDTTRRFRSSHALGQGEYLFGLEELRLPPGTWDVRLLVQESGTDAGGAVGRIGVTVPATSSFALSDLVLGREGSGLHWQGPAGAVPLNPLDAYPHEGAAELYYELSGTTAGTAYQTDIEVTGIYGDAKGTVHLTFNEKAATALIRSRRSIGLDKLEPGQYRITVTVTEQGTGRIAVQSRLLNVSK